MNNIMKTRAMKATSKKVMNRAWEIKHEDTNYSWGECLKMAWAEVKAAKASKKTVKAPKALHGSVVDIDVKTASVETLMKYTRETLIQVMKRLHVKRWYRIYDKHQMIDNIIKCAVA